MFHPDYPHYCKAAAKMIRETNDYAMSVHSLGSPFVGAEVDSGL
jgi:hypothetical protein